MEKKLNIMVVADSTGDQAMQGLWLQMAKCHDVKIICFEQFADSFSSMLPLIVFPDDGETPGYFRNLENFIKDADVIIGLEPTTLASFQAHRIARKYGIHFLCVTSSLSVDTFEQAPNVRAIRHDILSNAHLILCSSARSMDILRYDGIESDRLLSVLPSLDVRRFEFSNAKRSKFRSYSRIPEDSKLILIPTDGISDDELKASIRGSGAAIRRLAPAVANTIRILLCGRNPISEAIKYFIADVGLGGRTSILNQNISSFSHDLLSAADVLVLSKATDPLARIKLLFLMLSGAVSGIRIIGPQNLVPIDWMAGLNCLLTEDGSSNDIAMAAYSSLNQTDKDFHIRQHSSKIAGEFFNGNQTFQALSLRLDQLSRDDERRNRRRFLEDFVKSNQVPVSYKDASAVLLTCEEVKDFASTVETPCFSEILRIKGDALQALAKTDDAMKSFEDSLKLDAKNFQAMRGLGYIAWQGHSHDEAVTFFKRALSVNPNDYQSLLGIGLVYRRLKMFEPSVFWLRKAISICGLDSPALSIFIQACLEHEHQDEGLAALISLQDLMGEHLSLKTAINKIENHQAV